MERPDRKWARLRKKLAPKMQIEFRHKGAACPVCGYVFTNGFSSYRGDHGPSGVRKGETMTICTRCRRVLAVKKEEGAKDPVRVLDETGLMLLTQGDHEALALMAAVLDLYTQDLS